KQIETALARISPQSKILLQSMIDLLLDLRPHGGARCILNCADDCSFVNLRVRGCGEQKTAYAGEEKTSRTHTNLLELMKGDFCAYANTGEKKMQHRDPFGAEESKVKPRRRECSSDCLEKNKAQARLRVSCSRFSKSRALLISRPVKGAHRYMV